MICHFNKYKELAKKYNLPLEVVQKICDSQFAFTAEMISTNEAAPIYLQYLGTFLVKPNRRESVKNKRDSIKKLTDGEKNRQKE